MRPRLLLLIAAAALAAVHVVGVLFARPLHRPAELLAVLCLLGFAIRYDLLPRRGSFVPEGAVPAGRWAVWGLSGAVAVLVAGAALTVPPAPSGVGEWQILSPEEYSGLITRVQLTSLIPGTAALLFVLALLMVVRRRRGERVAGPDRLLVGTAIAAAVLIVGWVAVRVVVLEVVAGLETDGALGEGIPPLGTAGATAVAVPLVLALAALALTVTTAGRGRRQAAAGAMLLVVAALIRMDVAIGSATLPYAVHDYATFLSLDVIPATDAVPQPMPALIAALQLAAAVLIVAGLSRRRPNP